MCYERAPQGGAGAAELARDTRSGERIDVYPGTIPDFPYHAAVHVNYENTVLHMKDGLPKLKDFPAEMGESGLALPE